MNVENYKSKEGKGSKSSIGRKVAVDAIHSGKEGVMGATVNIADKIKMTINFNF